MTKILILLAQGFEEIEAVIVIDLLRRSDVEVVTVSITPERMVTGSHNITITADADLGSVNVDEFDGIFLPGGQPGTNNLKENVRVLEILRSFHEQRKWITAICAAPLVLQEAGILKGKRFTSYPATKESFQSQNYQEDAIVEDNHIITSRGIGTAIDFALSFIEILKGKNVRDEQAKRILWK